MSAECPDTAALQELIASGGDDPALEAHVGGCDACAKRLEELAGVEEFETSFVKAAAPGAHESVELSQLIDHLKAAPVEVAPAPGETSISERFPAGAMLDGYRVDGLIARGGMGVVLKAYDPELEREVAIKLLDPARFSGAEAAERFLREARAAAAIDHEHVLPVYTTGTSDDLPYLLMPFVEGETLQDRVEREGALAAGEVARIVKAVASGLAAAHSAGLVHRDVKPANILLEPDGGRVWIADFGLARAAEDASITRDGLMAGTPQFMSPEQAEGREADERSDLFSLGAVAYFMLNGKPPFKGDSAMTILRQVADGSPEWGGAGAVSSISNLTRRLMSKAPEARPRTASEVVDDIERQGRPASSKPLLVFAAVAVLALVFGGIWLVQRMGDDMAAAKGTVVASIGKTGYYSLADALEAAEVGAEIHLVAGAEIDAATLPVLVRDVKLSAPDGDVNIVRADFLGPVLDIRAAVAIDGVELAQTLLVPNLGNSSSEDDELPPILRVSEGGEVVLEHCRLLRPRPGRAARRRLGDGAHMPACIDVSANSRGKASRCEIASATSAAVLLSEGGRMEFERCILVCDFAAVLVGDGGQNAQVVLRESSFVGISAVVKAGDAKAQRARVVLDSNVLLDFGSILWTEELLPDAGVSVEEGNNLYCPMRGYAVTGTARGVGGVLMPARVELQTLAEWNRFCERAGGESIELETRLTRMLATRFNLEGLHPVPEQALERVKAGFRELRQRYPEIGVDIDAD